MSAPMYLLVASFHLPPRSGERYTCTSGALVIATSSKRRKYRSPTGQHDAVTPRATVPVPLCRASTYCSLPRCEKLVWIEGDGVVVVNDATVGVIAGGRDDAAAAVGRGSFAVVRMNSGDPRYQPMTTSSTTETIAAARIAGERDTTQV